MPCIYGNMTCSMYMNMWLPQVYKDPWTSKANVSVRCPSCNTHYNEHSVRHYDNSTTQSAQSLISLYFLNLQFSEPNFDNPLNNAKIISLQYLNYTQNKIQYSLHILPLLHCTHENNSIFAITFARVIQQQSATPMIDYLAISVAIKMYI